ncbi:Dihydroorotate dehydrogenase [Legionella beliardensis]|uniref:Dihydroorotate dehydrogenase (quinone) n=1 Tax=Legionella beliardensis TaxID=91822 RepID=A0A378I315_9GAMM|nr:quinone-dependent dihydroorotate dehydrogenase [Legionella beliardensis]STX29577.1 Dihydroorotate dehydrogenase [Legionella beliardensis]
MYSLIRPLLFKLEAEKAHEFTLKALHYLPNFLFKKVHYSSPISAMGLQFKHPIGLAAGLDKNGEHLDALNKLGFSFIEVGTVTPRPQAGNPKPRLFRLPAKQTIINRMGFNNKGVEALIANIRQSQYQGILGINIGKNKDTSLNEAVNDYVYCLQKTYRYASYITINISSPNTPDLRQLQQQDYLDNLLKKLTETQQKLTDTYQRQVPLVLKISPDEQDEVLKQMAEAAIKHNIAGIIATNTTCSRVSVEGIPHSKEQGGLSGEPLLERSTACLKVLKSIVGSDITLIGVGGIKDVHSAKLKLEAGADLLQVYTGLIYQGPSLIPKLIYSLKSLNYKNVP